MPWMDDLRKMNDDAVGMIMSDAEWQNALLESLAGSSVFNLTASFYKTAFIRGGGGMPTSSAASCVIHAPRTVTTLAVSIIRVLVCMLCLAVFIWNLPAPLTVWQRNQERVLYLTDGPAQAKTRRPRRFSDTGEDLKPAVLLPVIRWPVVRPRVVRAAAAVAVVATALIAQQARKRGSNGTGNRSHGVPRAAATPVFLPRGR
eukprot:COSAG05_NODE_2120_length_3535_cov_1.493597_2_plen_202_part_00